MPLLPSPGSGPDYSRLNMTMSGLVAMRYCSFLLRMKACIPVMAVVSSE